MIKDDRAATSVADMQSLVRLISAVVMDLRLFLLFFVISLLLFTGECLKGDGPDRNGTGRNRSLPFCPPASISLVVKRNLFDGGISLFSGFCAFSLGFLGT